MARSTKGSSASRSFLLSLLVPILLSLFVPQILYFISRYSLISQNDTQVVALTKKLVSISSPSGNDAKVFEYVRDYLISKSFNVTMYPIPSLSAELPKRYNLVALHPSASISTVDILLNTHLDTVPGAGVTHRTRNGSRQYIYGRGSVDAKGQAAAMIEAFCNLNNPSVGLLLVTGEESDHKGMIQASTYGFQNITLINGEPTTGKIVTQQKGMLKLQISATGIEAHSGYPHLGVSAVHRLLNALQKIQQVDWEDDVTLNIGVIQGGTAANVLAAEAKALVMFRIPSSWNRVYQQVRAIVNNLEGVSLELKTKNDALELYVPQNIAKQVGTTTVAYNTDLPYYKGHVKRMILFGAGSIEQAHTEEEWLEIRQLDKLPTLYEQIVQEVLMEDEKEQKINLESADEKSQ